MTRQQVNKTLTLYFKKLTIIITLFLQAYKLQKDGK